MRRIVVSNIVSLDGYFEGPNTGVMDLNMDAFFDVHNLECFEAADMVLVGATSYQDFSAYWPCVEEHESVPSDDPLARSFDETNRRISRNWNTKPVVVVSDTYQVPDDGPWAPHTTIIRRAEVSRWKQAGDEEVIVFGSHVMWNGLLAQGLVDEFRLMVGPAVLGGGTPAFAGPASLRLKDTRRSEDSDNVLLIYAAASRGSRT
jgi:dihydrofolate reductase